MKNEIDAQREMNKENEKSLLLPLIYAFIETFAFVFLFKCLYDWFVFSFTGIRVSFVNIVGFILVYSSLKTFLFQKKSFEIESKNYDGTYHLFIEKILYYILIFVVAFVVQYNY